MWKVKRIRDLLGLRRRVFHRAHRKGIIILFTVNVKTVHLFQFAASEQLKFCRLRSDTFLKVPQRVKAHLA